MLIDFIDDKHQQVDRFIGVILSMLNKYYINQLR